MLLNILLAKKVLIVTGPTGVGKTDFVLKLAAQFPADILNADMGQMYTPLCIGTAKPDWQNEPVPHHLFDILNTPQDFSLVQFRTLVAQLVPQIWARGKTPIIVGGSTMYIKSLFYAPASLDQLEQQAWVEHKNLAEKLNLNELDLWSQLNQIDPIRAAQLHHNDHYRIQRALDIWTKFNVLPSQCLPKYAPLFADMQLFIINAPKEILYQRIDARVHIMMQMGWLNETKNLDQAWQLFLQRKKIIGYEVILQYLNQGNLSWDEVILTIAKRVRNYAKRQQTFWRGLQNELAKHAGMHNKIFELDLTLLDVDLYIKQLLDDLKRD